MSQYSLQDLAAARAEIHALAGMTDPAGGERFVIPRRPGVEQAHFDEAEIPAGEVARPLDERLQARDLFGVVQAAWGPR